MKLSPLPLGGYSWLYALAFLLLLALLFGLFVCRQIARLRRNNMRGGGGESITTIGSDLPPRIRLLLRNRLDAVQALRLCRQPNFTDCSIFAAHAQSLDRYRMIAYDEVGRDLDRQLEQLKPELRRQPDESTWDYLHRIRLRALPTMNELFIARLAFLYESSRFRIDQPFGEPELEELRSLLKHFLHILSQNPQLTTSAPATNFPHLPTFAKQSPYVATKRDVGRKRRVRGDGQPETPLHWMAEMRPLL